MMNHVHFMFASCVVAVHHASGATLRRAQTAPSNAPSSYSSFIDFSSFSAGDVLTDIAPGINVTAFKRMANRSLEIADAMVFDTSTPTGQDYDLGSPHQEFGGPGMGRGGNNNSLFPNNVPQGNVLILSTDEDNNDPDDHGFGGFFMFSFDPPLDIATIGLLDNEEGVQLDITTADGGSTTIVNNNGGNNSFEPVSIGKPKVKRIVVNLIGSGAVSFIATGMDPCVPNPLTDLEVHSAGDLVTDLGGGVFVSAFTTGDVGLGAAMVFNTSDPSLVDLDLGTPHNSFGGSGFGIAGKRGRLFENAESLGNVLIVSADGNATLPNDSAKGGDILFTFTSPTYIDSIGVLDNESGFVMAVTLSDNSVSYYINMNGGNNSFERVSVGKPEVVSMYIQLLGSGAVTSPNVDCF